MTPNRKREVEIICALHPEAFGPPDETNDARRREFLIHSLIPFLNATDNGQWGYLLKTDAGGKIPCDVIMWRESRMLIDVMTGTGPTWLELGIATNPAWLWQAVEGPAPGPSPSPLPSPPMDLGADVSELRDRIDRLERRLSPLLDGWVPLINDLERVSSRLDQRYVAKGWWGTIVSVPESRVRR